MARNLEMAVGLHKGHKTTKTVQKAKPSRRKGVRRLDSVIVAFLNLNLNVRSLKGSAAHVQQICAVLVLCTLKNSAVNLCW